MIYSAATPVDAAFARLLREVESGTRLMAAINKACRFNCDLVGPVYDSIRAVANTDSVAVWSVGKAQDDFIAVVRETIERRG